MHRTLIAITFAIASLPLSAHAAEREVATLGITSEPALSVSVTRERDAEGGLRLRLVVQRKGPAKPKSLVLYEGGGDDDGPGDKDFRSVTLTPLALPAETRGVRVAFEFQVPGQKKHRQVDTFLVSVDDTPRVALEVPTRRQLDRSRVCHEVEETTLIAQDDGRLFVKPTSNLESDVNGDDDEPMDKACQGQHPGRQITYKFDGEVYLQIDPAPKKAAPAPKHTDKPAAEDENDD
jgi:hypothetical protein